MNALYQGPGRKFSPSAIVLNSSGYVHFKGPPALCAIAVLVLFVQVLVLCSVQQLPVNVVDWGSRRVPLCNVAFTVLNPIKLASLSVLERGGGGGRTDVMQLLVDTLKK